MFSTLWLVGVGNIYLNLLMDLRYINTFAYCTRFTHVIVHESYLRAQVAGWA